MRSESRADSRLFGDLVRSLLKDGISVRFEARGRSMYPALADGDVVQVNASAIAQRGDVALVDTAEGLRAHRVIRSANGIVTRGDCCFGEDPYSAEMIGAVANAHGDAIPRQRFGSIARRWIARWRGHF